MEAVNNPEDPAAALARCHSRGKLCIEREDFRGSPPKYFRLSPGREVRLRGAYF